MLLQKNNNNNYNELLYHFTHAPASAEAEFFKVLSGQK